MIFTVGLVVEYESAIDEGRAIKRGPHQDRDGVKYPGGWVWETAEEALAYLGIKDSLATRRVYGVLADWVADTRVVPGQPTRCLNRAASVVRVEQPPLKSGH